MSGIVPEEKYKGQLVFIETCRGCKYQCAYCTYSKNLKGITYYPLPQLKEEITFLLTNKNVTSIRITDAVFTSDMFRAKEILNHFVDMRSKGYVIKKLFIEYEYNDMDEELMFLISQLKDRENICNYSNRSLPEDIPIGDGFLIMEGYTVFSGVGIQSFNEKSLKAVRRAPIKNDKFEQFLTLARRYNVILKLDIILGLPHETTDTYLTGINRLLCLIEDTDHYVQFAFLQILPNSALEKAVSKFGIKYRNDTKLAYATNKMPEGDFLYCAKITTLVHRIVNSPMRIKFYDKAKGNYMPLLTNIYEQVCNNFSEFASASTMESVDAYNDNIFSKIPQNFLLPYLQ